MSTAEIANNIFYWILMVSGFAAPAAALYRDGEHGNRWPGFATGGAVAFFGVVFLTKGFSSQDMALFRLPAAVMLILGAAGIALTVYMRERDEQSNREIEWQEQADLPEALRTPKPSESATEAQRRRQFQDKEAADRVNENSRIEALQNLIIQQNEWRLREKRKEEAIKLRQYDEEYRIKEENATERQKISDTEAPFLNAKMKRDQAAAAQEMEDKRVAAQQAREQEQERRRQEVAELFRAVHDSIDNVELKGDAKVRVTGKFGDADVDVNLSYSSADEAKRQDEAEKRQRLEERRKERW